MQQAPYHLPDNNRCPANARFDYGTLRPQSTATSAWTFQIAANAFYP
jgi:hypothetical protein